MDDELVDVGEDELNAKAVMGAGGASADDEDLKDEDVDGEGEDAMAKGKEVAVKRQKTSGEEQEEDVVNGSGSGGGGSSGGGEKKNAAAMDVHGESLEDIIEQEGAEEIDDAQEELEDLEMPLAPESADLVNGDGGDQQMEEHDRENENGDDDDDDEEEDYEEEEEEEDEDEDEEKADDDEEGGGGEDEDEEDEDDDDYDNAKGHAELNSNLYSILSSSRYPIHDCIAGNLMDELRNVLAARKPGIRYGEDDDDDTVGGQQQLVPAYDVNERNEDLLCPIHLAILKANATAVNLLMNAGCNMSSVHTGSPTLHIAVSACAIGSKSTESIAILKSMLEWNTERQQHSDEGVGILGALDDYGRSAIHIAALFNLADVTRMLVNASKGKVVRIGGDDDDDEEDTSTKIPIIDVQDSKLGETAAHIAARFASTDILSTLIDANCSIQRADVRGRTLLHATAAGGHVACVVKVRSASQFDATMASVEDGRGETPAAVAKRNGHTHLIPLLSTTGKLSKNALAELATTATTQCPKRAPTVVCYSPVCQEHKTHADDEDPDDLPPENSGRVDVLLDERQGILNSSCFKGSPYVWDTTPAPAAIADVLRCHEWSYVLKVKKVCDAVNEQSAEIGNLDGDTAVSAGSARAAMHAAGSAIAAVDHVMSGRARNAFCPVRPPGHHAGPTGVVTNENDPHGSHGFCLLNNVAIAAAYALHMYRRQGIEKVALIDFDVHHGNGTQKIVEGLRPGLSRASLSTDFSEIIVASPTFKPWLDDNDRKHVFFASVHGFGKRSRHSDGWFYAGSGATSDVGYGAQPQGCADEDPNGEFQWHGGETPREGGARMINVGIPGPGSKRNLWRRSWRDKVLPALRKFDPDMIIVSAGFDAHHKDVLNCGYIGLRDDDYDWITRELVKVSNTCCNGRLVSVLEGGYRIQGGEVSPFARSVATHVRVLAEAHNEGWEFEEAQWERDQEAEKRRQKELAFAAERERYAAFITQQNAALDATTTTTAYQPSALVDNAAATTIAQDTTQSVPGTAAAAPEVTATPEAPEGSARKRRRAAVDYVALEEAMRREEAARGGGGV